MKPYLCKAMIYKKIPKNLQFTWSKLFFRSPYIFIGLFALGFFSFLFWIESKYSLFSVLLKQYFG